MESHTQNNEKLVIVSLGGSIAVPDGIDIDYLKRFNVFVRGFVEKGYKFVIVIGGGKPARIFQEAASEIIGKVNDEDKDWIGIHATRLNAQLLRTIFEDIADPVIFNSRGKIKELKHPVTIGSGWLPGWSTDYVTASIAADFKANRFINASKPDHVYDSDPSVNKDAKKFTNLSWKEYRKIIPSKWTPGLSSPIDPVAAELCEKEGIEAIVIKGKDLENFRNAIEGKEFKGTTIE